VVQSSPAPSPRHAIAISNSCVLVASAGAVSRAIDSALKQRRSATLHSSSCSSSTAPTRRTRARTLGKIPRTFDRLDFLVEPLRGFVLWSCRRCSSGKCLCAKMSSAASSSRAAASGNRLRRPSATFWSCPSALAWSGCAKIVGTVAAAVTQADPPGD